MLYVCFRHEYYIFIFPSTLITKVKEGKSVEGDSKDSFHPLSIKCVSRNMHRLGNWGWRSTRFQLSWVQPSNKLTTPVRRYWESHLFDCSLFLSFFLSFFPSLNNRDFHCFLLLEGRKLLRKSHLQMVHTQGRMQFCL